MLWIRNTSIVCSAVALLSWSALGVAAMRENALEARCSARGMHANYADARCESASVKSARFAKRHTWLVGVTTLSTMAAVTYGWWYFAFFKMLPRIAQREQQRQRGEQRKRRQQKRS